MRGRRLVPIATALLVVVAMSAASAAPADRPAERRGFGGTTTITTPAGGSATVTTGPVPGTPEIDMILGETNRDGDMFKTITFALLAYKPGKARTMGCISMAARVLDNQVDVLRERRLDEENVQAVARTRALAMAAMCMRLARLLAELEAAVPTRARLAPGKCDVAPLELKIKVERAENGDFVVLPVGKVQNLRKPPAKVTCKAKGATMRLRMTATKGSTIRKAVGKTMQLNIASPPNAPDDADLKVTFKKR